MPRYARILSKSSVYHVMLRGINRTEIFFDDEDRNRFIDTLQRMKEKGEYEIYAYCLMDNHVHLLIKEKREPINRAMKRIGVSYAYYFNKKYGRVGHLFQDRYRSEAVEKETYLLAAVRYIHNNPVIAGLVKRAGDYPWSSYRCYVEGKTGTGGLVESENVLGIFAKDRNKAVRLFEEYTMEGSSREFIDIEEYQPERKGEKTKNIVWTVLEQNRTDVKMLREMNNKNERDRILREINEKSGASVRELSRILDISKDIIFRA